MEYQRDVPEGPVEAVEAPPYQPGNGPAPRVHTYAPDARPMLAVRVEGEWRHCVVIARQDWPSGRTSYQVEIPLVRGGVRGVYIRMYWWDARAMRPVQGPSEV